jgi:Zn-dependent peptidase ImmA (M78 family)
MLSDLDRSLLYDVNMRPTKEEAVLQAEKLLETTWGKKFPVDPVKIARDLGIDVLEIELEPGIAGAILKQSGQDPMIFLNENDSPNRQRFTAAHELGHYVMHANEPDAFDYIDNRSSFEADESNMPEAFADTFASALLMPADEVRRLRREHYTPTQIAAYFGVSQDAAYFRLTSLES